MPDFRPAWENGDIEQLDEVTVYGEAKEATRVERIKNKSFGRVKFLDDRMRRGGMTLAVYLNTYTPLLASDWDGYLRIEDPSPIRRAERDDNSAALPIQYIILDGVILSDYRFLGRFTLENVDYIEVNRSGVGNGLLGGGGPYVKIVTDPKLSRTAKGLPNFVEHEFPLTFSGPKKFYTPFYENYDSAFFSEYGTITWLPDLKVDENGTVNFKVFNPNLDALTLNIEGTLDNGRFISERKTIVLND